MANYMYGLPGDDKETIKKTFELSLELCTSGWNTYPAMARSFLYKQGLEKWNRNAKELLWVLFHAYDTICLPTEKLKPWEI